MAKVKDNIITEGLSGKLGKRLVFRVSKGGKTIVALSPVLSEDREYNEAQLGQQEAFKKAIAYAQGAKEQSLYRQLAKGTDSSGFNVAVADWFDQPQVLELNTDGWTGGVGHTIRIRAHDDTAVAGVRVTIHRNGDVLENGEAVPSQTDGLMWIYTTTANLMGTPGLQLDAHAYDLAGNTGSSSVSLN